jgi:hypothetical protein
MYHLMAGTYSSQRHSNALPWIACLAIQFAACSQSNDDTFAEGGSGGSAGPSGGGGQQASGDLSLLNDYLLGVMDNQAQVDTGFDKLVERTVCPIPGRDDPNTLWLYVEHVEVLANGDRDAYFTRVNEIALVNGSPVSRAYKFAKTHPLYTDAFAFNGERNGCDQPDVLEAISMADLEYRDGCDVTFTKDGDVFNAATVEGACAFPGGYIHTTAEVFAEGLTTRDVAVSGGQETGDEFKFLKR